jgi:23S rRNA pseudouridine1911/1915/1917 synthase
MRVRIKTGRTHQIRVHSSYMGHSIVGDDVYGKAEKDLNGQLLHSAKISFVHPRTEKIMTFECELPNYFKEYINKIN